MIKCGEPYAALYWQRARNLTQMAGKKSMHGLLAVQGYIEKRTGFESWVRYGWYVSSWSKLVYPVYSNRRVLTVHCVDTTIRKTPDWHASAQRSTRQNQWVSFERALLKAILLRWVLIGRCPVTALLATLFLAICRIRHSLIQSYCRTGRSACIANQLDVDEALFCRLSNMQQQLIWCSE